MTDEEKAARTAEVDGIIEREFDRRNRQARYAAAGFPVPEAIKGWRCGCGHFNETEGDVSGYEHECASCGRRTFVEDTE